MYFPDARKPTPVSDCQSSSKSNALKLILVDQEVSQFDIHTVAVFQKAIIFAAAISFLPTILSVFGIPFFVFVCLKIGVAIAAFEKARCAAGVRAAIAIAVMSQIATLGFICLLVLNHRAGRFLKMYDVKIGFFGADLSSLKYVDR